MGPEIQTVTDNSGARTAAAIGQLAATLRGQKDAQDQSDQQASQQQQALSDQQAKAAASSWLAIAHAQVSNGKMTQAQVTAAFQKLQQTSPDVAKYVAMPSYDPSKTDTLNASTDENVATRRNADSTAFAAGTDTPVQAINAASPSKIGDAGWLSADAVSHLAGPVNAQLLPQSGKPADPSTLASTLRGQVPGWNETQVEWARQHSGMDPTGDQQGTLINSQRHSLAIEGETNRTNVTNEGFRDRSTTSMEGFNAARSGAENELATNRREQRDPNSDFSKTTVANRNATKTPKASDPMADAEKQARGLELRAYAEDSKAAGATGDSAKVAAHKANAVKLRTEAFGIRAQAKKVQAAQPQPPTPSQGGHFIYDPKTGKMTPIAGPSGGPSVVNDGNDAEGDSDPDDGSQ